LSACSNLSAHQIAGERAIDRIVADQNQPAIGNPITNLKLVRFIVHFGQRYVVVLHFPGTGITRTIAASSSNPII
jgi:hypothetical protein